MEIIKQLDVDLSRLAEELRAGKTLVYPTETCYGLGGDATNQMVVDRIFTIKERQREKALLVIVPNLAMIQELVEWDQKMDEIAKKYWPGPLTVVASVKPGTVLAQGVVSVDNTVAFRVTNHPFSAGLAKALNRPLISRPILLPLEIVMIQSVFSKCFRIGPLNRISSLMAAICRIVARQQLLGLSREEYEC